MSPLEQEDIQYGQAKAKQNYFKKSSVQPGSSVVLKIVDVTKNTATSFPIQGETFCFRYFLEDGRVWDETSATIFGALTKILHPDGKTLAPATVRLTKLVSKPAKGSQYTIEQIKTT